MAVEQALVMGCGSEIWGFVDMVLEAVCCNSTTKYCTAKQTYGMDSAGFV